RIRPTEGAYSALITFEDGAFATLTYSGYAHFDTDEFLGWVGEFGQDRRHRRYGEARAQLRTVGSPEQEAEIKNAGAYGAGELRVPPAASARHNHFGLVLVSCEHADLRPMPQGVMIYGGDEERLDPLPPPTVPRAAVIDEFHAAIIDHK